MDQEKARIQADLQGQISGEVHCDDLTLQLYSTDASIHFVKPLGVVRPANTEDVVNCVKYAVENHLSIHPRGAGSSFVGSSLGEGLILDFSHAMRRLLKVGDSTVTVQSGAVISSVNRQIANSGRRFGPDPMNRNVKTIGGTVALNTCGSEWPSFGSPSDKIVSMEIVLGDGTVMQTNRPETIPNSLINGLNGIQQRHGELIREHWPSTPINNAGYDLPSLDLQSPTEKLNRLMCGSEGTLGLSLIHI